MVIITITTIITILADHPECQELPIIIQMVVPWQQRRKLLPAQTHIKKITTEGERDSVQQQTPLVEEEVGSELNIKQKLQLEMIV